MSPPASMPPVVTSVTYDKPSYMPGDTVTATVAYTPGMALATFTGTGPVSCPALGLTAEGQGVFSVYAPQPTKADGFTDNGNRTWALVSDSGGVAVWTAPA